MEHFCDLHTHSVFSDGTYTPAQLLDEAQERGLTAIALTDHNTVAGLPDFLTAAQGRTVEAIPGAEFSADYEGTELHILALYLRREHFAQVTQMMQIYHRRKDQSNRDLVDRLNRADYAISYEKIKAATPRGEVNRALIAAELTAAGYAASVKAAFDGLLREKCGYYVPPQRFSPREILGMIRELGAVSVLAHPYLNLSQGELERFLQQARPWGLQGMEVRYATYDDPTTAAALATADRFGLLYSGGSDFHGGNKPDIRLGQGRGGLFVPSTWAAKIRENQQK